MNTPIKTNTQIKTSKQIILLEDLVMQNNLYQKTKHNFLSCCHKCLLLTAKTKSCYAISLAHLEKLHITLHGHL